MAGQSLNTTNHEVIRKWVEDRNGRPARVKGAGSEDTPGILRIDFPGYGGGEALEEISWGEWLRYFDEKGLEFVYQEETSDGERSRFNKLVRRKSAA